MIVSNLEDDTIVKSLKTYVRILVINILMTNAFSA